MKEKETQILVDTLDTLALALASHNHQWANQERKFYEKAILILKTLKTGQHKN